MSARHNPEIHLYSNGEKSRWKHSNFRVRNRSSKRKCYYANENNTFQIFKSFRQQNHEQKKEPRWKNSMPNGKFQAQPAMATVCPSPHLSGRLDGLLEWEVQSWKSNRSNENDLCAIQWPWYDLFCPGCFRNSIMQLSLINDRKYELSIWVELYTWFFSSVLLRLSRSSSKFKDKS